jgi:hypothetical protein
VHWWLLVYSNPPSSLIRVTYFHSPSLSLAESHCPIALIQIVDVEKRHDVT